MLVAKLHLPKIMDSIYGIIFRQNYLLNLSDLISHEFLKKHDIVIKSSKSDQLEDNNIEDLIFEGYFKRTEQRRNQMRNTSNVKTFEPVLGTAPRSHDQETQVLESMKTV